MDEIIFIWIISFKEFHEEPVFLQRPRNCNQICLADILPSRITKLVSGWLLCPCAIGRLIICWPLVIPGGDECEVGAAAAVSSLQGAAHDAAARRPQLLNAPLIAIANGWCHTSVRSRTSSSILCSQPSRLLPTSFYKWPNIRRWCSAVDDVRVSRVLTSRGGFWRHCCVALPALLPTNRQVCCLSGMFY